MKVKQLDQLRQIIAVKSRCPVILAGNSALLKTIMSDSARGGYECMDQFTSRLVQVLNLDEISNDRDGGLYTAEDVRRLYEYGGIRLLPGAVSKLQQILRTPQSGRLRTCSFIVAALHVSGVVQERKEITAEMIIEAVYELRLPVIERLPIAFEMGFNEGLNTLKEGVA